MSIPFKITRGGMLENTPRGNKPRDYTRVTISSKHSFKYACGGNGDGRRIRYAQDTCRGYSPPLPMGQGPGDRLGRQRDQGPE